MSKIDTDKGIVPENAQDKTENTSDDLPVCAASRTTKSAIFVAAVLIAAAAGAAAMAVRLSDDTSAPKIHYKDASADNALAHTSTNISSASVTTRTSAVTSSAEISVPEVSFSYPADINSASFECLASVNGINRSVAENIVKYREAHERIHDLNELLDVYGVGERTLSIIKEHFYISEKDRLPAVTTLPVSSVTSVRTTASKTTIAGPTTTAAPKTTTTATSAPAMRLVNINTASAEELAECLLIAPELAEAIVELRENIGQYVNDLELLYVDGFSEEMLVERRKFICL